MVLRLLLVIGLISALSACSHEMKHKLGMSKSEPDEFTVVSNPPLIVPPIMSLPEPGDTLDQKEVHNSHLAHEDGEIRKELGLK
jgi:Protein of unknown function (DUF3035)